MPDLTEPFVKVFDAIRSVTMARPTPLRLFSDNGDEIATVTTGWKYRDVVSEQAGGRVTELEVTDRANVDFALAVFFTFGGFRYERAGFPNPPTGNPRKWVWNLRPVGVDA